MGEAGEHLDFFTLFVIALAVHTTCVIICIVVVVVVVDAANNTLLTRCVFVCLC